MRLRDSEGHLYGFSVTRQSGLASGCAVIQSQSPGLG
jgi:hypothetical protein